MKQWKKEMYPSPHIRAWTYQGLLEGIASMQEEGYTIDTKNLGNVTVGGERRVYFHSRLQLGEMIKGITPENLHKVQDCQIITNGQGPITSESISTVPDFLSLRTLPDTLENKREVSRISSVFNCGEISLQKYKTIEAVIDEFECRYTKQNS